MTNLLTMTNLELTDAILIAHKSVSSTGTAYRYHEDWTNHLRALLAEQLKRARERDATGLPASADARQETDRG